MARRTRSRRSVRLGQLRSRLHQCAGEPGRDLRRQGGTQLGQPKPRSAEVGSGKHDAGADDPDADLAGAGDREHERIPVQPARRAELIAGDDRRGVAGQRRRVGGEVAEQRRGESAPCAPQRQSQEKGSAILREAGGEHHDRHRADQGADHAKPPFAQRSAEMGLTHERGRGAGPIGIVEFEPERDVKGETDRRP
jgi:hypothetical protein